MVSCKKLPGIFNEKLPALLLMEPTPLAGMLIVAYASGLFLESVILPLSVNPFDWAKEAKEQTNSKDKA